MPERVKRGSAAAHAMPNTSAVRAERDEGIAEFEVLPGLFGIAHQNAGGLAVTASRRRNGNDSLAELAGQFVGRDPEIDAEIGGPHEQRIDAIHGRDRVGCGDAGARTRSAPQG